MVKWGPHHVPWAPPRFRKQDGWVGGWVGEGGEWMPRRNPAPTLLRHTHVISNFFFLFLNKIRGGKIGPTRWVSPIHPELGSGCAIKLLVQKKIEPNLARSNMDRPDPAQSVRFFFAFKRLFDSINPVFRKG